MTPIARLRALLERAAAGQADATAIADAAGAVFGALRRTDMRSGVANMIRRLAVLDATGEQLVDATGWRALAEAAALLERPDVAPADVRGLDEQLQALGLDVDRRPVSRPHEPGPPHPN
jgi:hypothetical protein